MNTTAQKEQEDQDRPIANQSGQNQAKTPSKVFAGVQAEAAQDKVLPGTNEGRSHGRPDSPFQRMADRSLQAQEAASIQRMVANSPQVREARAMQRMVASSAQTREATAVQRMADKSARAFTSQVIQRTEPSEPFSPGKKLNGITMGENEAVKKITGGSVDLHASGASVTNVSRGDKRLQQVGARSMAAGGHALIGHSGDRYHEMGHMVQQLKGDQPIKATKKVNGKPVNDNPGLEHDATKIGTQIKQMKSQATGSGHEVVQRSQDGGTPSVAQHSARPVSQLHTATSSSGQPVIQRAIGFEFQTVGGSAPKVKKKKINKWVDTEHDDRMHIHDGDHWHLTGDLGDAEFVTDPFTDEKSCGASMREMEEYVEGKEDDLVEYYDSDSQAVTEEERAAYKVEWKKKANRKAHPQATVGVEIENISKLTNKFVLNEDVNAYKTYSTTEEAIQNRDNDSLVKKTYGYHLMNFYKTKIGEMVNRMYSHYDPRGESEKPNLSSKALGIIDLLLTYMGALIFGSDVVTNPKSAFIMISRTNVKQLMKSLSEGEQNAVLYALYGIQADLKQLRIKRVNPYYNQYAKFISDTMQSKNRIYTKYDEGQELTPDRLYNEFSKLQSLSEDFFYDDTALHKIKYNPQSQTSESSFVSGTEESKLPLFEVRNLKKRVPHTEWRGFAIQLFRLYQEVRE